MDSTCALLGCQCYITLVNEGVFSTSHAIFFYFLFKPSYDAHLHWSMLYNIGIPMVHKYFTSLYSLWYAGLLTNCFVKIIFNIIKVRAIGRKI